MTTVYLATCDNGLPYEDGEEYHLGEFPSLDAAKNAIIENLDDIRSSYMMSYEGDDDHAVINEGAIWIKEAEKLDNGLIKAWPKTLVVYDYQTKTFIER